MRAPVVAALRNGVVKQTNAFLPGEAGPSFVTEKFLEADSEVTIHYTMVAAEVEVKEGKEAKKEGKGKR